MTKLSAFGKMKNVLAQKYASFATLWSKSREEFGPEWEREFSANISAVFGPEPSDRWDEAVNGYAEFCVEALRAHIYFEKHGEYQNKDYKQVLESCYRSSDYMERRYLPGQYLSHYVWPHHQRMLARFTKEWLPVLSPDLKLFYEVGVGCGMYSQRVTQLLPSIRGVGFDISDYALRFTQRVVEAHGAGDRYAVRNQDIISKPIAEKADLVICQEVLEHLEDPARFICGLFDAVRPGGWGYITAAVNAGHTDHIYLYRSSDEVRRQVEAAGWRIIQSQVEVNYPEKQENKRPTIAGYLARRIT
ncbi:MAG: class I SAM-dependent methyltransferase [bacterium]